MCRGETGNWGADLRAMDNLRGSRGRGLTVGVIATHIEPATGYGGVVTSISQLVRHISKYCTQVYVCASNASVGGRISPEDTTFGPNVEVTLYRAQLWPRWGFGLGAISNILTVCRKSDAVYVGGIATWPTTIAALLCWCVGTPFIVSPRGGLMIDHVKAFRKRKPLKRLFYYCLTLPTVRRAKYVHCTSAIEAQGVREIVGRSQEIVVIPNGVTVDAEPAEFEKAGDPRGGVKLLYIGRISREKDTNAFVRAWLAVRGACDNLTVLGSGSGPYYEEFLDLLKEGGEAIDFRGYVGRSGIQKALEESHFTVFPSGVEAGVQENFGNAVAESLSVGRPVVVAKGLAWDFIENAGAGILFERNVDSLKEVLSGLRGIEATSWQAMCRSARLVAVNSLDIAITSEAVFKCISDCVVGGRVGKKHVSGE